jgi:hypothetical protein
MHPLDKLPAASNRKTGAVSPNHGSHRGAGAVTEPKSLLVLARLLARVAAGDWFWQPLATGTVEVTLEDKPPSGVVPSGPSVRGDPA